MIFPKQKLLSGPTGLGFMVHYCHPSIRPISIINPSRTTRTTLNLTRVDLASGGPADSMGERWRRVRRWERLPRAHAHPQPSCAGVLRAAAPGRYSLLPARSRLGQRCRFKRGAGPRYWQGRAGPQGSFSFLIHSKITHCKFPDR